MSGGRPDRPVKVEMVPGFAPHEPGADHASVVIKLTLPKEPEKLDACYAEIEELLLRPLTAACLYTRMWRSQDSKSIFVQTWASRNRLELEANRVGFALPLEPTAVRSADVARNTYLQAMGMDFSPSSDPGKKFEGDQLAIGGDVSAETKEEGICGRGCLMWVTCGCFVPRGHPYEFVYGPYSAARRHLFRYDWRLESPVDGVSASQLLYSIIEAKEAVGGAGLNLDRKLSDNLGTPVNFPAHDAEQLKELRQRWSGCCGWIGPVRDVHNYWGSEISFYTAFLRHFTVALMLPTIIGAALYGNQIALGGSPDRADWTPLFGVLVALVCAFVFEQWRRQQSVHAMEWGTSDVSTQETLRPEFLEQCEARRSLVTGKPEFYPRHAVRRTCLRGVSAAVVSFCIGVVVVVVLSIFYVRVFLARLEDEGEIAAGWSGNLAGIFTAIQIQLMGFVYKAMAKFMTDVEGHRTDREYKNSLVAKITAFTFINDYYSLIWIAFVKPAGVYIYGELQTCKVNPETGLADCMLELQGQLATILIVRLIIGNVQELFLPVIIPRVMAFFTYRCASEGRRSTLTELNERRAFKPIVETEAELPEYDPADDYLELFELFGYAYLFLPAWPLASLVALFSGIVEMYVDSTKLLRQTRRPRTQAAQSIGVWVYAFECLAIIAIVTNLALIMFTSNTGFFRLPDFTAKLQVFIGLEHLLVGGVILFKYLVPDSPEFVRTHLARQAYLVGKLLDDRKETVVIDHRSSLVEVTPEQSADEVSAVIRAVAEANKDIDGRDAPQVAAIVDTPPPERPLPSESWSTKFYAHGPLPPGREAGEATPLAMHFNPVHTAEDTRAAAAAAAAAP